MEMWPMVSNARARIMLRMPTSSPSAKVNTPILITTAPSTAYDRCRSFSKFRLATLNVEIVIRFQTAFRHSCTHAKFARGLQQRAIGFSFHFVGQIEFVKRHADYTPFERPRQKLHVH